MRTPILDLLSSPVPPSLIAPSRQWPVFESAEARCAACKMFEKSAAHCVPGEGNPEARIALLGEGLGADEEREHRCFVGRAGQMLDRCIEAADLTRPELWIMNSTRCRPVSDIGKNRKPTITEIEACRGFTAEDVQRVRPRVIVALGDSAAVALFGKLVGGVTENRGKVKWHEEYQCWVIVSFHPAYAVRFPAQAAFIEDDLRLAKRVAEFGYAPPQPTQIEVVRDVERLAQIRDAMLNRPDQIFMDWETVGTADASAVHLTKARGFCLALTQDTGRAIVIPRYLSGLAPAWSRYALPKVDKIIAEIAQSDNPKGGSNLAFDFIMTLNTVGVLPRHPRFDAQLAHHLLHAHLGERAHGLKVMAARYTDMGRYDDALDQWLVDNGHTVEGKPDMGAAWLAPDEMIHLYIGMDVDAPCRLEKVLWPQLVERGVESLYLNERLPLAMEHAIELDRIGVRIDGPYLETLSEQLGAALTQIEHELIEAVGPEIAAKFPDGKINPASHPQVGKLLFEELDMPIMAHTDTGKPATGEEYLLPLRDTHPAVGLILRYRTFQKIKGTWVDGTKNQRGQKKALRSVLDEDGYARMSTRVAGPETLRFATRKPFAVHTFPKNDPAYPSVRRLIIPSEHHKFSIRDYKQQEWAIQAIAADQQDMIEAILDRGEDIHEKVARDLGGVAKSEYVSTFDEGGFVHDGTRWKSEADFNVFKKHRSKWKSVNFMILFRGGPRKLARMALGCKCPRTPGIPCEHEGLAREYIQQYYERYEQIRWWQYRIIKELRKSGVVTGLFGALRQLPGIFDPDNFAQLEAERQACNFPIQNGGAHVMIRALLAVQRRFKSAGPTRAAFPATVTRRRIPVLFDADGNQIDTRHACASCGSRGFDVSILPDRCTFCDGTESGNFPESRIANLAEHSALPRYAFPGRVVVSIHDQLIVEAHERHIDEADAIVRECMEAPYPELGGRSLHTDGSIADCWI